MADYDAWSGAGMLRLTVNTVPGSADIANNRSQVSFAMALYCSNGTSYNGSPTAWSITINGQTYSGSFTFDFRNYTGILIFSGTQWITHNADGSKSINSSGAVAHTGTSAIGGPIAVGGSLTLPTIPRATTPTVSPSSGNTGASFTIGHTPASSGFYHDIAYSLDGGSTYTNIATNVAGTTTSTGWTPAHSLLPNTTSATAIIRLITRSSSGGTIIGTKTVNLPLTVPASIKPSVSSVTWGDAQTSGPDIPTLMGGAGRFVQRWSRLIPTVTSVAGSGATGVVDTDVIQNGQTTDSGTAFTNPIAISGATPYTAYAYDSRGRVSDPYVNTVAVTAYNYPNLPVPTVVRTSDAAGNVPSPTGTYLAITPAASVSSLNFSGEKNLLEYQIRTRPVGGSWTTVQAWTATGVSGNTWTAKRVLSGYASSNEYEVEISIRDLFGKNGFRTSQTIITQTVPVASESVFMDWDEDNGIGLGKYRTQGMLDIFGQVYQNNGQAVIDESDVASDTDRGIVELATSAETVTGTDATRAVTPAGLTAAVAAALALLIPAGNLMPTARLTAPVGWLLCNGQAVSRTTYPELFAALNVIIGNPTVTIASPGVFTLSGHNLYTGDQVYLTTTGALPTGLSQNTNYWVIRVSSTQFRLATSLANANAGTAINTSGSQSGTHTIRATFGVGNGSTTFNVPDLRGRTIAGVDTSQAEFAANGELYGTKTEVLGIEHLPGSVAYFGPSGGNLGTAGTWNSRANTGGSHSQGHNNVQPTMSLNYLIKT